MVEAAGVELPRIGRKSSRTASSVKAPSTCRRTPTTPCESVVRVFRHYGAGIGMTTLRTLKRHPSDVLTYSSS